MSLKYYFLLRSLLFILALRTNFLTPSVVGSYQLLLAPTLSWLSFSISRQLAITAYVK